MVDCARGYRGRTLFANVPINFHLVRASRSTRAYTVQLLTPHHVLLLYGTLSSSSLPLSLIPLILLNLLNSPYSISPLCLLFLLSTLCPLPALPWVVSLGKLESLLFPYSLSDLMDLTLFH